MAGWADAAALALKLEAPDGGTELGAAIETAIAAGSRDLLVLTDGKTWASEVHSAASRGCRISAVLVGPASLDAAIGHLASITGGQVFAAQRLRCRPGGPFRNRIDALSGRSSRGHGVERRAHEYFDNARGNLHRSRLGRGADRPSGRCGRPLRVILALPLLDEPRATSLAVEHGLCSHLTSLVLVDEEGRALDGLPEMRKVPLAATYLADAASALDAALGRWRSSMPDGSFGTIDDRLFIRQTSRWLYD